MEYQISFFLFFSSAKNIFFSLFLITKKKYLIFLFFLGKPEYQISIPTVHNKIKSIPTGQAW